MNLEFFWVYMTQGYLASINLYTGWSEPQMLNPEWQQLIGSTQEETYNTPMLTVNLEKAQKRGQSLLKAMLETFSIKIDWAIIELEKEKR